MVYHAYRFAPGAFIVAAPPAHSAADFLEGYISLALMRWALPFLGLVSGYLFFRSLTPSVAGFAGKLRSRMRTLLVPFLIWSGLGVLFAVAVTHSPYRGISDYWTIHSLGEALDRWLLHPVIYPLWFLQALMTCMLLSPLVYLALKTLRGWVLVIAVLWWALGWQPLVLWPWVSATAFPPFIVGAAIAILGWGAPWAGRKTAPAWLTAVVALSWLATAALFAVYGHELGRWARAGLLPVVVLGILTAWLGFDALKGLLRPPAWLIAAGLFVAPLSFFVYVTQEPTLAVLRAFTRTHLPAYVQRSGGESQAFAIVRYLLAPTIAIAGSIGAALLLRRLAPRVYAVTTGGRGRERRATR